MVHKIQQEYELSMCALGPGARSPGEMMVLVLTQGLGQLCGPVANHLSSLTQRCSWYVPYGLTTNCRPDTRAGHGLPDYCYPLAVLWEG